LIKTIPPDTNIYFMRLLHTSGANVGFAISTIILLGLTILILCLYIKRDKKLKIGIFQKFGILIIWIFFSFFMFLSIIYLAYIINSNPLIILFIYLPIIYGVFWIYKREVKKRVDKKNTLSRNIMKY
jgi:amino acid transporter